ncbi:hypothetical protein KCP77_06430 [Salmonella enterica subsp. enterica]|nr:hypothetical protein KCP77_06430 [Salmonella enterica subsp. enterica]
MVYCTRHPGHVQDPAVFPAGACQVSQTVISTIPRFCRFSTEQEAPKRRVDWRHQPAGYDRAPAPRPGVNLPVTPTAPSRQHG